MRDRRVRTLRIGCRRLQSVEVGLCLQLRAAWPAVVAAAVGFSWRARPFERGKEPSIGLSPTTREDPPKHSSAFAVAGPGEDLIPRRPPGTPVALVNQAMAKQVWGDTDPLGRRASQADRS